MQVTVPVKVRKYWKNILALIVAVFLLIASLWQLEICHIAMWENRLWVDLPFYITKLNVWFYRDLCYLGIIVAFILQFLALWYWE